jgi:hypothetical protein
MKTTNHKTTPRARGEFELALAPGLVVRNEGHAMEDWIETKTAKLLSAGRRSGFFREMIHDAEEFEREGYVWSYFPLAGAPASFGK